MKIPRHLESPNVEIVRREVTEFDNENEVDERALNLLLEHFPKNVDPAHVLLKVASINSLYRTQIFDVRTVANFIVEQKIDAELALGSVSAVEKIAKVKFGAKERWNYSFATKYCSWHRQDVYPIYDSRVERCLRAYAQQAGLPRITEEELWNYERYQEAVLDFKKRYELHACSLKDIDKFLYRVGNKIFYSETEDVRIELPSDISFSATPSSVHSHEAPQIQPASPPEKH